MASFCPGTPALHVSFTCVKYEPSQCWETHRKAFLSWELLFTWGMNWNSYWRAEGLSFGGNLKESRTHYKKREKKCSELRLWDQTLWCFALNPQTPVWTSSHACGNVHATTWSCRGGWQLVAWPLFQGLFVHGKGDGSQGLKIRLSDSQSPLRLFPSPVVFISKSSIFQSDGVS